MPPPLRVRRLIPRARLIERLQRIAPYVAVLALFFVVRLAFTSADPPLGTPDGQSPNELMVEPVAKAYEARTWALHGVWQTSELDNYGYWRPQSWAWVYPLALWFRVFGVSYASLHVFTTIVGAAGLVAVMLLAAGRRTALEPTGGARAAVLVGVMIALNWYDVAYHRAGLLETAVNTWIAWTFNFLHRGRTDGWALAAAQITFFLGFFSKLNVVVFAPIVLVVGVVQFTIWIVRAPPAASLPRRLARWSPLALLFVLVGLVALYCSSDAYTRTLVRNSSHVLTGSPVTEAEKLDVPTFDELWDRYAKPEVWKTSFLDVLPIAAPLAALQVLRLPIQAIRRVFGVRPTSDPGLTIMVFLWLASATLPFAAAQTDVRFRFGTIAPASLLAAFALTDGYLGARALVARLAPRAWTAWSWATAALVGAASTGTFVAHAASFKTMWFDRKYDIAHANARIGVIISNREDPVVVGSWAGPLVFETPAQWYYVRAEFNATRAQLAGFGLTHVLMMPKGTDFTGWTLQREFQPLWKLITKRETIDVRGRPILVYEVTGEMTERP